MVERELDKAPMNLDHRWGGSDLPLHSPRMKTWGRSWGVGEGILICLIKFRGVVLFLHGPLHRQVSYPVGKIGQFLI